MSVTVSINGKREETDAGQTLAELLESLKIRPTVSVVFVNKERIGRDDLAARTTADGDLVEIIIQFAGGSDV